MDTNLNCKIEGRTFIHFRLGPHTPAMAVDDALDDGQPHTGAFELTEAVQALKDPKEFMGVLHIKADPIIAHIVDH